SRPKSRTGSIANISRCFDSGRQDLGFILRDASLRDAPQDEVFDPHGEEPRICAASRTTRPPTVTSHPQIAMNLVCVALQRRAVAAPHGTAFFENVVPVREAFQR